MRKLKSDQPGYFEIFEGDGDSGWYFACKCPCGCQYDDIVPIYRVGVAQKHVHNVAWQWDGDLQKPTLVPSFKRHTPCGIHFNITGGKHVRHDDPGTAQLASNVYQG